MTRAPQHHDVVVVGSGFGGSVAALRLVEKGYDVTVLEAGRRFADEDFAKTSWDLRRFLWAPRLGLRGIQRIHLLPDVLVLAGAGVGGGSLNYANTLYRPGSAAFYEDPQWAGITDWRAELAPHYDTASAMLGVVTNPSTTPVDLVYREVAEEMGVGHTFRQAPVGVFFGRDGSPEPGVEVEDPYFGGAGPRRTGCIECGECMVGCRYGAKNTLVKNYLWLAERAGARVVPDTTVVRVVPREQGGYAVHTRPTASPSAPWRRARPHTLTADHVVLAAGAWGTQHLLHRLRRDGDLPHLSDRLGHLTRTNSESLLGALVPRRRAGDLDLTRGVAITSSFYPTPDTHVEPVRYGRGQNAMGLLVTLLTDGGGRVPRPLRWAGQVARHPLRLLGHYTGLGSWSERTTIALVMQSRDNSITVGPGRGLLGRYRLTSRQGHGEPNPTWIPVANDAVRRIARRLRGWPGGSIGEIFDVPMTAHFLGGCAIGDSPRTGVVDAYHRVFGHPGLHVVDGSAVSANLGVNPSLTITAQAERAMSLWPAKGGEDPRPAPGQPYRRVAPVPPVRPAVAFGPAATRQRA
ncbi:GMC family oxidoreductase [Ornithinimicrobium avium]|uniref:Cholesterol oxidase n=1 Tax=Ornithinimicrobium avium TaxID=2283195 RepID=A0A345NSS2_9MICO|nr:GMC family oxidoreductase [Ornithinimicrobium avium]AXH98080.1 GMC family oxidoreductase [Ornithinimicrobium avium]